MPRQRIKIHGNKVATRLTAVDGCFLQGVKPESCAERQTTH